MKTLSLVSAALLVVLAGCATSLTTSSSTMSAADLAAIVDAANQGEIQQGQAAATKATNQAVKDFANMMVTDHTKALQDAQTLWTSHGVTPNDANTTAQALTTNSQQTIQALSTYNGAAFDRQYVQTQVNAHQYVLQLLDSTLIPNSAGDLHKLLTDQRATVATHLDRARQLLGTL